MGSTKPFLDGVIIPWAEDTRSLDVALVEEPTRVRTYEKVFASDEGGAVTALNETYHVPRSVCLYLQYHKPSSERPLREYLGHPRAHFTENGQDFSFEAGVQRMIEHHIGLRLKRLLEADKRIEIKGENKTSIRPGVVTPEYVDQLIKPDLPMVLEVITAPWWQ